MFLLVVLWFVFLRPTPAEPPPRIVSSPPADTVPVAADPNAIGLCALNRTSGALEGQIIGIGSPSAADAPRYHVQTIDERRQTLYVRPEAVVIDHCDRAIRADPRTPPVRVEEDT